MVLNTLTKGSNHKHGYTKVWSDGALSVVHRDVPVASRFREDRKSGKRSQNSPWVSTFGRCGTICKTTNKQTTHMEFSNFGSSTSRRTFDRWMTSAVLDRSPARLKFPFHLQAFGSPPKKANCRIISPHVVHSA